MAMATNTTPGSVILAGDLTGSANAPELRATGVIPGTYFPANIITDAKGRVVWAKQSNWIDDLQPLVPIASYSTKGVCQVYETTDICNPQLLLINGELRLNMQDASTTLYGKVTVDAVNSYLEIVGSGLLKVKYATVSSKGIIQPGIGLIASAGVLSLDTTATGGAAETIKGIIQVGTGINIDNGIISLAYGNGTDSSPGLVQIGSGLSVTSGVVSLNAPDATASTKGIIQVGSNISVTSGVISVADATTTSKGVLQVGSGLSVAGGVLTLSVSSYTEKGLVQVQANSGIDITAGVISVANSTASSPGVVQVGSNINVTSGVISVATATGSSKGLAQIGSGLSVTSGVVTLPSAFSTTATAVLTRKQTNSTVNITGNPLNWSGNDGNIFTTTLTQATTLNNGTNIKVGSFYHFIISGSQVITYDTQFKFKPNAIRQPYGTTSVLSCYAVDANTLYCQMQPNFA